MIHRVLAVPLAALALLLMLALPAAVAAAEGGDPPISVSVLDAGPPALPNVSGLPATAVEVLRTSAFVVLAQLGPTVEQLDAVQASVEKRQIESGLNDQVDYLVPPGSLTLDQLHLRVEWLDSLQMKVEQRLNDPLWFEALTEPIARWEFPSQVIRAPLEFAHYRCPGGAAARRTLHRFEELRHQT